MPLTLSPLHSCDVSAAHAVYNRAFDWLRDKGVRQWLLRVDETVFATRQAAGEAFAIHVDGALAGAVFFALETIPYYTDALKITPQWWMHTLVIDRAFAGQRTGAQAVAQVCALVRSRGGDSLWLHCVNDANYAERMPNYYARLGFVEIERRDVTYATTGNTFPMVVMRNDLSGQIANNLSL
jgi:ribosomal protein S18 acetylase RimI-like enzyme